MTCARKSSTASRVIVPTLFGGLTGQARYVGCRCRRPAGPISVSVMADDDATIARPRDLYERLEWLAGWRGRRSEERRVGKSVDLGGRRIIKKKKKNKNSR